MTRSRLAERLVQLAFSGPYSSLGKSPPHAGT